MRRARAGLVLALALVPAAVPAQAPGARAALVAFRDSLAATADAGAVRAVRDSLRREVYAAMDDLTLMRLGYAWHRVAELSDRGTGHGAARSAFEEVTERRPDWPLAWDGIAEAALGEHRATSGLVTGIVDMFGGQPLRRVARHFIAGAMADSTWTDGLRRLADSALRSHDADLREIALEALRLAAPLAVAADGPLRLARARLERDDGILDSAHAVLDARVREAPDDAAAHLELGRLRFLMGRVDGLAPWYRGLGLGGDRVWAAYRRDLALVFPDSVLARLDGASPAERVRLARREWQRQDPDGLPVIADRLRDHYRRFDFARRHYRLRRDPPPTDPLDWAGTFDARGITYVRHGQPAIRTSLGRHGGPDVQATLRIVGAPPNETWRYGPPDSTARLYHFVVREPGGDFTLAESVLDILGLTAQYRMFRSEDVPEGVPLDSLPPPIQTYGGELVSIIAQELLLSRSAAHPVYERMVLEGKRGAEALQLAERTIGRTSNAAPPYWTLRYELPLTAELTILAVGQQDGQPQVQVGFAIAGSALLPIRTPRGVGYQVRLRAAVMDAAGEVIASVDTTRGFLTGRALRPEDHLLGQLPIAVPPGTYRVRVALEADGLGLLSPRTQVVVVPPVASAPAISDLALGTRRVRLPWVAATGDTAWINPFGRFRAREPLELYFEVVGIPAGESYRTELAVIRVSGRDRITDAAEQVVAEGGRPALTLGFSQRHPGGVAGVSREVALDRLRPGEYVLEVRVIGPDGREAVRRRPFVVDE